MIAVGYPYVFPNSIPNQLTLADHLNGFDIELANTVLSSLDEIVTRKTTVNTSYILTKDITEKFKNLELRYSDIQLDTVLNPLLKYNRVPIHNINNFLCSFNGSQHVGRQLLTAIIYSQGLYNSEYCSKLFISDSDLIDGEIQRFTGIHERVYRKFFKTTDNFNNTINQFAYDRCNHVNNVLVLEKQLTNSFVHLVSETMATSYYPFITEKFLYSVVTKGMYVAYAQPHWHAHLSEYFGFRKFDRIFDYNFDTIQNPVERVVALVSMLLKFSKLTHCDWQDLYEFERETIEFNYDHYYSGAYLTKLKKYI